MNIHLLSSQSRSSRTDVDCCGPGRTATGHPPQLPEDLSAALREQGHQVEVNLLGDTLHGHELTSLRESATAGRRIAARLGEPTEDGRVLHALDAVAWAAALTARSLADVSVVLRLAEPALAEGTGGPGPPADGPVALGAAGPAGPASGHPGAGPLGSGAGGLGSGRVSPIGSATERRAYRACLRSADAVAATEDEDRLAAVRAGVRGESALIVPDVVGTPDVDAVPMVRRPGRHLLSLNGIGAESGIGSLLAAMRRLPDRDLVVTGPGTAAEGADFYTRLGELALTDRVQWQGGVDRATAIRLIDAAALLVLPSPGAATSTSVLGMSRARAVVTVSGGPAADTVIDGITGTVLPDSRPEVLAPALQTLLSNPFRLEAMGLAGRERAHTRYARDRAVSATEQVYRVALGTP